MEDEILKELEKKLNFLKTIKWKVDNHLANSLTSVELCKYENYKLFKDVYNYIKENK